MTMPLQENSIAPDFSLKDKHRRVYQLSNTASKFIILYFYPKDDTPGCTIEAKEFTRDKELFKKLRAEIIGISGGDESSKKKFCEKYDLNITLLSDPDFAVSKKYDVYGEKSFLGKKFFGIKRTTFIISKGKIMKVYENVSPQGHASEILAFLKTLK
jgi:peroxiredoxin Q/BCP